MSRPKGFKHTEETKRKIRLTNIGKRHIMTEGGLLKMHLANTRRRGTHTHTSETREKIKRALFGIRRTTETKVRCCRAAVIREAKSPRISKSELEFEDTLKKAGIPYQRQVPLLDTTVVDFLVDGKIVVYCDGAWHYHHSKNMQKDLRHNKLLKEHGYLVFRFSDKDLRNSEECLKRIKEAMCLNEFF